MIPERIIVVSRGITVYTYIYIYKVKQSHYRPGVAQRVPGSEGSQISWQQHMMVVGCQPYAPAAFTPRKCFWYSFPLEAASTPGPYCDRKDFMPMKNPMTPAGIEPATFRFVGQHLNHCDIYIYIYSTNTFNIFSTCCTFSVYSSTKCVFHNVDFFFPFTKYSHFT